MDIKALIFDLDGTLVNTVHDVGESLDKALALEGFPPNTLSHYKAVMGAGILVLISKCVPEQYKNNENVIKKVYTNYSRIYGENYCRTSKIYPEINEVLNILKQKNYRLAVLSNKTNKFTKEIVKKLFDNDIFEFVQGRTDGIPLKPNPTSVIDLAAKMDTSPENTMYIGDSEVDVLTALNAKMQDVAVLRGFRSHSQLIGAGATTMISSPKELLSLLDI